MSATLGFFTQNELDAVVGYSRRRQRLVEGNVLPPGQRVKTFGQEPIIFPEFAVAGLVAERPSPQDEPLLRHLASAAAGLYETASFSAMATVLRTALRGRKGWQLDDLVAVLLERAADELVAWREQVAEAERQLAEAGIRLSIDVGRIEDVSDAGYRVALVDSGDIITVAVNAARTALPKGMWVTRDLVELGARKGELLVPTVAPDMLATMPGNAWAPDTDEAQWDEMFRNVDFKPVVVPMVCDAAPDAAGSRGDLVRPKRRLSVRANRALYANANTMVRSSTSTPATAR
ncbi:MAG TPA: hypothetical protein VKV27_09955 [Solirubrobacteraceae bacterium]|nr:hypothetical protein [Solirubrobacteraceae bacterium]